MNTSLTKDNLKEVLSEDFPAADDSQSRLAHSPKLSRVERAFKQKLTAYEHRTARIAALETKLANTEEALCETRQTVAWLREALERQQAALVEQTHNNAAMLRRLETLEQSQAPVSRVPEEAQFGRPLYSDWRLVQPLRNYIICSSLIAKSAMAMPRTLSFFDELFGSREQHAGLTLKCAFSQEPWTELNVLGFSPTERYEITVIAPSSCELPKNECDDWFRAELHNIRANRFSASAAPTPSRRSIRLED